MHLQPKFLFPGQQENEQIHLVTRQHWFILFKHIVIWLVFVVFLFIFDSSIAPAYPSLSAAPAEQFVNFVKTLYIMLLVAGLFTIWVIYYLNFQIVTNERIVDMTQKNLLHHTTSELHLGRLQDVTAEIKGVFGTFFDYGNVYVQTAGEQARFQFDNIPDPQNVAKLILDLYEKLPAEQKVLKE